MSRAKLGAYRLLGQLLYGEYSHMQVQAYGLVQLSSLRRTARLLGTETKQVRIWLNHLEDLGYLQSITYSTNPDRSLAATFRIRAPSNVFR